MKKFFVVFLSMIAVCVCAVALTACGEKKHTHSYSDKLISPTCTEQGYTLHSCVCGDNYKDTYANALGHDEISHSEQAATCSKKGWQDYVTCSRCDYTTYQEIDFLPHLIVIDDAVSASCTQTGLTEGSHCSKCGKTIIKQTIIDKIPHKESDWIIDSHATCSQEGNKHTACSVCGTTVRTQSIDRIAHAYGNWTIETQSSCSELGIERRDCTKCDEYETRSIAMLSHTEVIDKTIPATCSSTGLTQGSHCSVCGKEIVKQVTTNKLAHDYGDWEQTKPATCIETGIEQRKCKNCNASETQSTALASHTEVIDEAVSATCSTTGLTEGKHCSVCNTVLLEQYEIAKTTHSWVIDSRVEPTCTETGLTSGSHCSVCGEILQAQEIVVALGHSKWYKFQVFPTCTESGLTEGEYCTQCGMVFVEQEVIPATGHYEQIDSAIAPTCTQTGLTEGKHCYICDYVIVAQEVIPIHEPVPKISWEYVTPTCTKDGWTEGTACSLCHESIIAPQKIPALGHDWICTTRDLKKHSVYCKTCSTAKDNSPHEWEDSICLICNYDAGGTKGLSYKLNDNKTSYTVNGIGTATETDITIPAIYNGLPVTNISVFNGRANLTSLMISDNIVSIEQLAFFGCENLIKVIIGNNCKTIGLRAFANCINLHELTINSSITSMGNQVFYGCNIQYATIMTTEIDDIPKSSLLKVALISGKQIYDYDFYNCISLKEIVFPDTLEEIGDYAFYGCSGLTELTIPASVKIFGTEVFGECNNVKKVTIDTSAINYIPKTNLETVIVASGEMLNGGFANCNSLKNVTLPETLISIGNSAFMNCTSLTNITIPQNVSSIYDSAFYGCNNLTDIVFPEKVSFIGASAFYGCSKLTNINIPAKVTFIGQRAFENCSALTNVVFENTEFWKLDGVTLVSSEEIASSTTAALYLTSTYRLNSWHYKQTI